MIYTTPGPCGMQTRVLNLKKPYYSTLEYKVTEGLQTWDPQIYVTFVMRRNELRTVTQLFICQHKTAKRNQI